MRHLTRLMAASKPDLRNVLFEHDRNQQQDAARAREIQRLPLSRKIPCQSVLRVKDDLFFLRRMTVIALA
jgi:hypothetical protein